jgi:hypothetical protein
MYYKAKQNTVKDKFPWVLLSVHNDALDFPFTSLGLASLTLASD